MSERAQAVVIGSGMGGLAAAVVLAGEGLHVTVLEAQPGPGGYASAFERGPYRFDTALHALNGLAPGGGADALYRLLGIHDRLRLHRLDPIYRAQSAVGGFDARADLYRFERDLIELFPGQRDGIRSYLDEALAAYRDTRRLEVDHAAGDRPTLEQIMARYPALIRISAETWEEMLTRHVSAPGARALLASLWGYGGLPPSRLSALVGVALTSYHEHGAWYPEGGARAISDALVTSLRERGGAIRYDRRVTGIELGDDHATAVLTAAGERVPCDLVVSNASAPTTALHLVGRDRLPADYVARIEEPRPSYTTFSVFLGLDRDVFAEHGLPHELFVSGTADPTVQYDASLRGDWERCGLSITDYTQVDPGCAPPGHGTVVLTVLAGWDYEDTWGTGGVLADYGRNPRYQQVKESVADALIANADRAVPGLAAAVRLREAATPLTNHRYTANPRGAIEGYENSPQNSGLGWLPNETPIRNLFLAGAWTTTGGMNPSMASGVAAARLALRRGLPVGAGL